MDGRQADRCVRTVQCPKDVFSYYSRANISSSLKTIIGETQTCANYILKYVTFLALQLLIHNFCINSSTRPCSQDLLCHSSASRRGIPHLTSHGISMGFLCRRTTGRGKCPYRILRSVVQNELFCILNVTQSYSSFSLSTHSPVYSFCMLLRTSLNSD